MRVLMAGITQIANETQGKWEIPLRWLYATFPLPINISSVDSSEATKSSFSWIEEKSKETLIMNRL